MEGGTVVVPEDVELAWMSVCENTGHHHPARKSYRLQKVHVHLSVSIHTYIHPDIHPSIHCGAD